MSSLRASVVIPSHNRRPMLERVLLGLAAQTVPASDFEVIVILDGCTDDSEAMLESLRSRGTLPNLRWIVQMPGRGQATGRNTGAAAATAPVLVFVDDDIIPRPNWLAAHLGHHPRAKLAVLGDCPLVRPRGAGIYTQRVWAWWSDYYHRRAHAGHRPGWRDFAAGSFSIGRDDFLTVGGFDAGFTGYGGEDYELGYRLQQAGFELVADAAAVADHHHVCDLTKALRAARQEAHGDVLLSRKHPSTTASFRFANPPRKKLRRRLCRWATFAPPVTTQLLRGALPLLMALERWASPQLWGKCYHQFRELAYWAGVGESFESRAAWRSYIRDRWSKPLYTLDITDGLPEQLPGDWGVVPCDVEVVFERRPLGRISLTGEPPRPLRQYVADRIVDELHASLCVARAASGTP